MNIVVFGAGSIGSLFGGVLSKNNEVYLIGRKKHVETINKKGLTIKGKTQLVSKIKAESSFKNLDFLPDLILLTVKSYDTKKAVKEIKKNINKKTILLTLQNGLNIVESIKKSIPDNQIVAGLTTHGAIFSKPGEIVHSGFGETIIGELNCKTTNRIKKIQKIFIESGIKTIISEDIQKDIWLKAIVNSTINPLTSIFQCKNGYLNKNPVLLKTISQICRESTLVACSAGYNISYDQAYKKTIQVIKDTYDNYSSMLQSVKNGKKTEIDSINGYIIKTGEKNNIKIDLNKMLEYTIKSIEP